jgi:hypothetical protein
MDTWSYCHCVHDGWQQNEHCQDVAAEELVKSEWMAFLRFILRTGCIGVGKIMFEFVFVWVIAKLLRGYIQQLKALERIKHLELTFM